MLRMRGISNSCFGAVSMFNDAIDMYQSEEGEKGEKSEENTERWDL